MKMKKIILSFVCINLAFGVYSQKIIKNPGFGYSTAFNVKIRSIELRDSATVITFHATTNPLGSIVIPKQTYIKPDNGNKLYITKAEGIVLNERLITPPSGESEYKLFFPKINSSVRRLDYGEEGEKASWFIYDILLKEIADQSVIPIKLKSNWFNKITTDWECSFFDSTAVYKKKVWNYGKVNLINGEGTLELKNDKNRVTLTVKPSIDGSYFIGEEKHKLYAYVQNPIDGKYNDEGYDTSIFKHDSVKLIGYFKGFSPRISQKTISIYINDILSEKNYPVVVNIDNNGVFSVNLPLYYPHSIFINSANTGQQIFLEPGKDLFVLFDNPHNKLLFMGESEKINRDLDKLRILDNNDFSSIFKKMPDLTPFQYKNECLDLEGQELNSLKKFRDTHSISTKAYQVKMRDIQLKISFYLLIFNEINNQAIRLRSNKEDVIRFNPDSFTDEFFDFLKSEKFNDPLAIISTDYMHFVTQLELAKFIHGEELTYSKMIEALESSGYSLTPEENQLKEDLKVTEKPESKEILSNFIKQYGRKSYEFYKKYSNIYKELIPGMREGTVTETMAIDFLNEKGVNFTNDEREYIEAVRAIEKLPIVEIMKRVRKPQEKFYSDHQEFLISLRENLNTIKREENFRKLGIEKGLVKDVLNARNAVSRIQLTPFSDEAFKSILNNFNSPFIIDYLKKCNKLSKEKIETNKKNGASVVNQIPKIAKENLFEELIKKYSGKVVLVDFWATWCGPCRDEIEQIKSLKEEMANEQVVFVYITGPSSPKQTFDYMITSIRGEHYRVSDDEWKYLNEKFSITGLPHHVLVDKKGKVISTELHLRTNEALKTELEKRINE